MFCHPFVVATIGINFLRRKGGKKTVKLNNIKDSKYLDCLFPVHQYSLDLVELKGNVKNLLI